MTDAERTSREDFYRNLIWVIDGRGFQNNFDIYHMLPDPESELARDLVWEKATRPMKGATHGIFYRLSRNRDHHPDATKATLRGGWIEGTHAIQGEVEVNYRGHHQFDWVRPHRTWLETCFPVYIDFGGDALVKLETYDESGLRCIRLVTKRKFMHDVMIETDAAAVATRFYPFSDHISAPNELDLSQLPFRLE